MKKYRLKGVTLVETIVAMVILFGVLTLMFTGFSLAGNYLLKGMRMRDAAQRAMEMIETVDTGVENGVDVSSYPDVSIVEGSVTLSAGGSTETIEGKYYTTSSKVEDISTDKTMYYTVFKKNPPEPPAPASLLDVGPTSRTISSLVDFRFYPTFYDGSEFKDIPAAKKDSIYILELSTEEKQIAQVNHGTYNGKSCVLIKPKKAGTVTFFVKYNGEVSEEITVTIT